MFTLKRSDRGEHKSTSGRNLSQGYPVPVKDVKLYKHTECYVWHRYGHFADQFPDKNPTQLILRWLELFWCKMATWLIKHGYFWTLALHTAWQTICNILKTWIILLKINSLQYWWMDYSYSLIGNGA